MNAQQEATISTLHDLIHICRDGEEGFRKASECVHKNAELKMLLMSFSLQRGKFARELEAEVATLGGEVPSHEGSFVGVLHRWWMNLESMATYDNRFILGECERGEDAAKEHYAKAIHESLNMPDSLRALLLRQEQEVVKVHDVIKRRRDGTHSPTEEKMENVKDQINEKVATTKEKIKAGGEEVQERASELWEETKVKTGVGSMAEKASVFIRENPIPILLGALGTGMAIGLLFYARELRQERERMALVKLPLSRLGLGARAAMEEFRSRAKDHLAAVQDRMEDIEAQDRKGAFMKKISRALAHWND